MSEHQRQTAFLRQCLLYDDTEERHRLEVRITQLQRDELSVRRAVWLMALLAVLFVWIPDPWGGVSEGTGSATGGLSPTGLKSFGVTSGAASGRDFSSSGQKRERTRDRAAGANFGNRQ